MRFPLLAAALAASLFLPSCVGAPEQPPARTRAEAPGRRPALTPASAPAPASTSAPVAAEWEYRPATPGSWSYGADAAGSASAFTRPGAGPLLTLRCDRAARSISVVRAGAGRGQMVVRTSYGAAQWPASVSPAGTVAARAANDAVLDQIAYSRGRFAVEVQGLEPLILPAWAEVGRVIEDCRA